MAVEILREQHRQRAIVWIDKTSWLMTMGEEGFVLVEDNSDHETSESLSKEDMRHYLSTRHTHIEPMLMHYNTAELVEGMVRAAKALGLPEVNGRGIWFRGGQIKVGDDTSMYTLSIDSKETKEGLRKEVELRFQRYDSGQRYPYKDVWFTKDGGLGFPMWKAQVLAERWGPLIMKASRIIHANAKKKSKYSDVALMAVFDGGGVPFIGPTGRHIYY